MGVRRRNGGRDGDDGGGRGGKGRGGCGGGPPRARPAAPCGDGWGVDAAAAAIVFGVRVGPSEQQRLRNGEAVSADGGVQSSAAVERSGVGGDHRTRNVALVWCGIGGNGSSS